MYKKIQLFGAGLFVLAALTFAGVQAVTPVAQASARQNIGCCRMPQDCAGGMSCTGPIANCSTVGPNPPTGTCVQATPGPQIPTNIPGQLDS